MMPCQLGLESGLGLENRTATEMNYHLESQGAPSFSTSYTQILD